MEAWFHTAIAAARGTTGALGVRTHVQGLEHLPRDGAAILACTHVSYPDFLPVGVAARKRGRWVRFMTRHDVWNRAWSAYPMTRMRHIPVDREAPAGAYLMGRRLLREGEVVGMFPEAGISYSYTVRPLMRGAASLARETGAPVIPVAIWGTQRIYSVGRPDERGNEPPPDWTRRRRIDLTFGPALPAPGEDLTAWTIDLGHVLTDMLEDLQRLPHHRPAPGEHAPWYPAHLGGHAPDRFEALTLDSVPRAAVLPVWGPPITPPAADDPRGGAATT